MSQKGNECSENEVFVGQRVKIEDRKEQRQLVCAFLGIFKLVAQQFKIHQNKDISMTSILNNQPKTAGRWTRQEHEKFLYGLKLYGKNWKKIQDLIETRTSTQIRSHAQKFFIKMKKLEGDQEDSLIDQHSSHFKLNQQTLITQHDDRFLEKQHSLFSFYFEQIAKNYLMSEKKGENFNFWDSLVEVSQIKKHKSCELISFSEQYETGMKKMHSFQEYNKEEIAKSCKLIRTSHSSFQEYKD